MNILRKSALPILLCFLTLYACKKEEVQIPPQDSLSISVQASADNEFSPYLWNTTEKKVCVVFGYGYNSPEFVSEMKDIFKTECGLAEDGGLILSYTFPDDFKVGSRNRIALIRDLLEDQNFYGIIFIGAPENTHNALISWRKDFDGQLPFPVFSFFPQDDILGMEYVSDFVLEMVHKTDELVALEEETVITAEIPELIVSAAKYMTLLSEPLHSDVDLHRHVQRIVGNLGEVRHYIDPESSIPSINHFVLNTYE